MRTFLALLLGLALRWLLQCVKMFNKGWEGGQTSLLGAAEGRRGVGHLEKSGHNLQKFHPPRVPAVGSLACCPVLGKPLQVVISHMLYCCRDTAPTCLPPSTQSSEVPKLASLHHSNSGVNDTRFEPQATQRDVARPSAAASCGGPPLLRRSLIYQ